MLLSNSRTTDTRPAAKSAGFSLLYKPRRAACALLTLALISAPISFVKACQDYFTNGKHGKKIEISEFKELTQEDKIELRDLLIQEGYNVNELVTAV